MSACVLLRTRKINERAPITLIRVVWLAPHNTSSFIYVFALACYWIARGFGLTRFVALLPCLLHAVAAIYGSYKHDLYLLVGSLAAIQIVSTIITELGMPLYEDVFTGDSFMLLAQLLLVYATR
jgi:hypothetical protein